MAETAKKSGKKGAAPVSEGQKNLSWILFG